MSKVHNLLLLCFCSYLLIGLFSCEHEPGMLIMDDEMLPIDTTIIDTTGTDPDTTVVTNPCDDNVIYFDRQILPILLSNCAFSGCHDDASAEDGVILTSYEKVFETADVEPFDLDHSEIYEVLVEDKEDKRMPPPPRARLSSAQINLIAKWILQGGLDKDCDPNAGGCDTDNVSFAQTIQPVIKNQCQGCHSGSAPSGGINLSSYDGIKTVALNGRLVGAVDRQPGFEPMPQGGAKLNACYIAQLKAWVSDGAPNN